MNSSRHEKILKLVNKCKEYLSTNQILLDAFKKYNVDISELFNIPIKFGEVPVSARTEKGIITLNKKLIESADWKKICGYLVHEIVHYLQQTTANKSSPSSAGPNYLNNPKELEGFQNQIHFLSDEKGFNEAQQYAKQVVEHHDLKGKEKDLTVEKLIKKVKDK
jgi:hypothetical protein